MLLSFAGCCLFALRLMMDIVKTTLTERLRRRLWYAWGTGAEADRGEGEGQYSRRLRMPG